jgi:Isoleucyl-tRNA synthetase
MAEPVFQPLPTVPDHAGLEEEVLAWWDAQGIFEKLRERNRGGPIFSFFDGPVTANKSLAVTRPGGAR